MFVEKHRRLGAQRASGFAVQRLGALSVPSSLARSVLSLVVLLCFPWPPSLTLQGLVDPCTVSFRSKRVNTSLLRPPVMRPDSQFMDVPGMLQPNRGLCNDTYGLTSEVFHMDSSLKHAAANMQKLPFYGYLLSTTCKSRNPPPPQPTDGSGSVHLRVASQG